MQYDGDHCLIAEGGPKYPDYLAFSGAGSLFVISEHAARIFRENNLSGISELTPIRVAKETDGSLCFVCSDRTGALICFGPTI